MALLVLAAGCTSIAGLDDLRPAMLSAPARVDASQPAAAGTSSPAVPDATDAGDAEAGADAVAEATDAARDAGDAGDAACWLSGECACHVKEDCPGTGFECCNGHCTDTSSDALHCGFCGNPCTNNQVCEGAKCGCGGLEPDQACVPNVCIDFMTNAEHCGECNHSCLGGMCLGQACQPVPIATQQDEPIGVAVDGDNVYFANSAGNTIGKQNKLALTACAGDACTLFKSPLFDQPVGITTQDGDDTLFVANVAKGGVGKLVAIPKSYQAGAEQTVITATGLSCLTMRAGVVYFASRQDQDLVRRFVAHGGGGVSSLATQSAGVADVTAVAVDDGRLYFGATSTAPLPAAFSAGLFYLKLDPSCTSRSCLPTLLYAGAKPRAIALTKEFVFWISDDDKLRRLSKACAGQTDCPVLVLADGQSDPQAIVADSDYVYWTNAGDGTVRRTSVYRTCKGIGCQAITPRLGQAFGLAQDERALYITTRSSGPAKTGIVWRLAK